MASVYQQMPFYLQRQNPRYLYQAFEHSFHEEYYCNAIDI